MMNKTVILIQLIISSSLPNPIDEIIISKDVVDFKITNPETILKIDEGKPVLLKYIDDMIPGSEVNQNNKIYTGLRRWKEFEEPEATITTTTTNFEMDVPSSGDDLEDVTDSPIELNFSNNAEEEFVPNIPNDEYNAEWDLFDDIISTRRMLNNFEELSEEIKETTFLSVPEVNKRVSSVEEKQTNETDDYLENTQNQNILDRIAQQTLEIKKENKNEHLESIQNYNVKENNERRTSKINKEEKQHVESMRVSNQDRGRKFDNNYGIQRVPFIYLSPSEIQRSINPSIPIDTINSDNFNNHKINRISPVAIKQDFEDYSLYKPAVLSQKSMITNIILKLAEATENSHKFAASNEYFNKTPFTSFHNNVNKNKYVP